MAVDDDFPIEGYDTMRVSQILPALEELDLDDLDHVREREEQGKNRTTVLRRIDTLITELEAEEEATPAPTMASEPVEDDLEAEGLGEMEDFRGDEDEEDVASLGAMDRTEVMPAAAPDRSPFPIPDYDRLPVAQILPLLDDLTDEELDMVVEREEQGKNRAAILDRIDDMFEPVEEEAAVPMPPPPPAPTPVVSQPAPARKAPAKKAGTAKAPAKKAPAKVATKAAGKAAKVPARSAKTPAKASVKKAAAQKTAPVAKPSPVKAPPPVKAAGKRSPAKAAPPAKKAAKKG